MIVYTAFQPSDLRAILPHTYEQETWRLVEEHIPSLANGHAVTCLQDGKPIACGGLVPVWDGVAEAWLALTPAAIARPFMVTRNVVRFLRSRAAELHLHRVQAHVDASFEKSWKWMERMGFQRESTLAKYGPRQQDYYLYVWFPE